MNKKEAERLIAEQDLVVPPMKSQFEIEMDKLETQEKEIMNNTSLSSDQRIHAISSVDMVRQKLKVEHRRDIFSASIKHNKPLFEAVRRFASGQGIEPAWSTPDALQQILEMHKEIMAKASDPLTKGVLVDITVRLKEIKEFRADIVSTWEKAEQVRKDAEDFQVRTREKIRLVEEELLGCAEDAFEAEPRYIVLKAPEIAARLMGEALPEQEQKTPQTSTAVPAANQENLSASKQYLIGTGEYVNIQTADGSKTNPQHKILSDAITTANIRKAIESGIDIKSNKSIVGWIGKKVCGLTDVITDHSLESKINIKKG